MKNIRLNTIADNLLKNTIYFKILWAILVILKINPPIREQTSPLFIFLIIYGIAIILYDFFTDKNGFNNKYIGIILLFITLMGISTVVNYKNGFISNMKTLVVTAIQLIAIARIDLKRSKKHVLRDIKIVNDVIIIGVTIASLISLYLFVRGINTTYTMTIFDGMEEKEFLYYYGMAYGNRLVGIFLNPNSIGAFGAVSMLCAAINLVVFTKKLLYKILYGLSIIIILACVILSNSRAALLALNICIFFIVFMMIRKSLNSKKNKVVKTLIPVVVSSICIITAITLTPVIDGHLRKVPTFVASYSKGNIQVDAPKEISLSETRLKNQESSDMVEQSSGRIILWKMGLTTAKLEPIFGVGKAQLNQIVHHNWGDRPIYKPLGGGGLHNIFLETLVAYGFPTVLVLIIFIAKVILEFFIQLLKDESSTKKEYFLKIVILSMLIFSVCRNMFESGMLYSVDLSSFAFMLYLGYTMYFIQENTTETDNIIYRLIKPIRIGK